MCHRRVFSLPGVYQNSKSTEYYLENGLTKIYKQGLEMRKNYQGYIESENFGQSRSLVAFKITTADWSVYRRVLIIAIYWIFLQNGLTKIYKQGLEMKKNYQGYIESENFGQSGNFVALKMATKDWSVYRTRVNYRYKLNFSPKRLNQNLQTRAWNEETLPRIHWIRKFWPISKFCCLQNGHRRLVGLPGLVFNRYKLNFFSKMA